MSDSDDAGTKDQPTTTLLIVDDQPVIRAGLRAMLAKSNVEVIGDAATGLDAAARVRAHPPDIVLMDVSMPDMDGLEATREIKQTNPEVAVIMVTSFESESYLRQAIDAGAAGYVLKGASREQLLHSIEVVGDGGSMFDPALLAEMLRQTAREGSGEGDSALSTLTPREYSTLQLITEGRTNPEIATEIGYSTGTIKNDVRAIIKKLAVSDRTQAAAYAVRHGIESR